MRESVIYQDILAEGKLEGMQEEALSFAMRLLTRRFGTLEPELESQICGLTKPVLEELGEALLEFSDMADLVAWLQARQGNAEDERG